MMARLKATGLPCPDCRTRGMIRVADMTYRCRDAECGAQHHLRYIMARLCAPTAEPPRLTLIETAR